MDRFAAHLRSDTCALPYLGRGVRPLYRISRGSLNYRKDGSLNYRKGGSLQKTRRKKPSRVRRPPRSSPRWVCEARRCDRRVLRGTHAPLAMCASTTASGAPAADLVARTWHAHPALQQRSSGCTGANGNATRRGSATALHAQLCSTRERHCVANRARPRPHTTLAVCIAAASRE